MNIEQKQEYLRKYRLLQAKINRMGEMMNLSPDKSEYYKEQMKSAYLLRDKIENEIDSVDGGILSEILSQKYICGKSLEEIGYCINYCKRQVERLHLKALEKFAVC